MSLAKPRHDPFFSRSLEHSPIARAFLKQHMPLHLQEHVDLESLVRVDRTHTDTHLKKRHKDIIYKASLKEQGDLLACLEHQRGDDLMMPLRYLRYSTDGLAAYLQEGHKKWPLIVNLLFYHGAKSPYPYGHEAADYYAHPRWGSQELWIRFHVIDVTQLSDEELLAYGLCAPMEVLLKHGRDGNFELEPSAYSDVFHVCIAEVGEEYIFSMLAYATERKDLEVGKRIYKFIEQVLQDKQELIMTYGQQLRQEGIQQEKQGIARNMLGKGYSSEVVTELTGLAREALNKLPANS